MWGQAIYSHCRPGRKCGLNCEVIQCAPPPPHDMHKGWDHALHILSPLGRLPPGRVHSTFINVRITAAWFLSAGPDNTERSEALMPCTQTQMERNGGAGAAAKAHLLF